MFLKRWLYKLTPTANRWSEATPAACCGVCRTCATGTAVGLAATAVGFAAEAVGARRRQDEEQAPQPAPTVPDGTPTAR